MLTNDDIQNLIKAQKEVFVTKEEFEGLIDIVATKKDINTLIENVATKGDLENCATKSDLTEFKSEILSGHDKILQKLDILLDEKPMKDAQDNKRRDVLNIHNKALKRNKILSEVEVLEINKLQAF